VDAEVDDFAIGGIKSVFRAGVSACADLQGVISWLDRDFDCSMTFY